MLFLLSYRSHVPRVLNISWVPFMRHSRKDDKYYCLRFGHILVKEHLMLNLTQFYHNFTLFLAEKNYMIFTERTAPPPP